MAVRSPASRRVAARVPGMRAVARPAGRNVAASGRGLRLAGVGNEAVLKATGKGWDEWLRLLDRAGAKSMPHKDIAMLLTRKFHVSGWWSQMVAVGYEQARGLRAAHQRADGYATNATRTIDVTLERLYGAWSDPKARARWLPGAPLELRRSTEGKSLRMTWSPGESRVDIQFSPKGAQKSQVQVQHARLPNATSVKRQKAFWTEALERLKALLETR